MRCVYHPERSSSSRCTLCQVDLCPECALQLEDGRTICHRCMVALSVQEVRTETVQRRLEREARELGIDRPWRPSLLQVILAVGFAVACLLLALQYYWDRPVQAPPAVIHTGDPIGLLGDVQMALERYAAVHDGNYPDSLYLLFPAFVPDTPRHRQIVRFLDYRLDEQYGFLLKIKDNAPFRGQELLATATDIIFPGVESEEEGP